MRSVFIFVFLFAVCKPDSTPQIRCGYSPSKLYSCLGSPQMIKPDIASKCASSITECERITCIYEQSQWLSNKGIEKEKISDHMDTYRKENPEWEAAVQQAKISCLRTDLPAQGVYTNCPAYDVTECILTSFVKYAQPSQWSTSKDCEYPRQFAGACTICPADCFSPVIPVGTCNACLSVPHSSSTTTSSSALRSPTTSV